MFGFSFARLTRFLLLLLLFPTEVLLWRPRSPSVHWNPTLVFNQGTERVGTVGFSLEFPEGTNHPFKLEKEYAISNRIRASLVAVVRKRLKQSFVLNLGTQSSPFIEEAIALNSVGAGVVVACSFVNADIFHSNVGLFNCPKATGGERGVGIAPSPLVRAATAQGIPL